MAIIVKCTGKCKETEHEFQDTTYGKGNRVANFNKDATKCTCTVCATQMSMEALKAAGNIVRR